MHCFTCATYNKHQCTLTCYYKLPHLFPAGNQERVGYTLALILALACSIACASLLTDQQSSPPMIFTTFYCLWMTYDYKYPNDASVLPEKFLSYFVLSSVKSSMVQLTSTFFRLLSSSTYAVNVLVSFVLFDCILRVLL